MTEINLIQAIGAGLLAGLAAYGGFTIGGTKPSRRFKCSLFVGAATCAIFVLRALEMQP